MRRSSILVVEDEPGVRFGIRDFLESEGYTVDEAESCRTAEAAWGTTRPDAMILDYSLPDGTALELLPRLKALDPTVPIVILTGHGSIDLAVRVLTRMLPLEAIDERKLPGGRRAIEQIPQIERLDHAGSDYTVR